MRRAFAASCRSGGGFHRLFFLADDTGIPERDPTLDELQALAREVTGDETPTLSDPQWLTHSRFQHGHSRTYAAGRVLLAGDAGHVALPIGGQGMNSGFHDAVGVAWRLAMTLRGQAAPVVLDSDGHERGGEHARLDGQQARGFKRTVYRGPAMDAVLALAITIYPGVGALLQGTEDLQQLDVRDPDSPLNEDHLGASATTAGRRRGSAPPMARCSTAARRPPCSRSSTMPTATRRAGRCSASTGARPMPGRRCARRWPAR